MHAYRGITLTQQEEIYYMRNILIIIEDLN